MGIVVSIIIVVIAVLLILVVLIQNSKGGGLASNFSAPSQVMGVKKTNDFIEQATWGLAIVMLVLCIGASYVNKADNTLTTPESKTKDQTGGFQNTSEPANVGGGSDQGNSAIIPTTPKETPATTKK